jgi:hypothetical protein
MNIDVSFNHDRLIIFKWINLERKLNEHPWSKKKKKAGKRAKSTTAGIEWNA